MFSIFSSYPTFLVFLAIVLALVLTIVLMPAWIRALKSSHIGQQVRADGPQSHLVKQGTPTMGGVIMLIAVAVVTLLVGVPVPETFLLLGATLLTGVLGFIDDASKVAHERSLGLTPAAKLVGQFFIAGVFVLVAVNLLGVEPTVEIPFVYTFDLGIITWVIPIGDGISVPVLYVLFTLILLVGMCNAVNLTDGLDGLASGTVMIVMIVMAAIAYRSNMLEPAIFAAALAGCLHRLPVVQFLSCGYFHGRYRFTRSWYGARLPFRRHQDRVRRHHHRRPVRRRGSLGYDPGVLLQAHEEARFSHGSASSPLREEGVERDEGGRPLLDRIRRARCMRLRSVLCRVYDGGCMMNRHEMLAGRKLAPARLGRVVVLGLGVSGRSCAAYLLDRLGGRVSELVIYAGSPGEEARRWAQDARLAGRTRGVRRREGRGFLRLVHREPRHIRVLRLLPERRARFA